MSGRSGWDIQGPTVALTLAGVTQAESAKQRLKESGFSEKRLSQMPPLQIVLADASLELKRIGNDAAKGHLLPSPLSHPLLEKFDVQFLEWASQKAGATAASVIGGLLFPAVRQAREAQMRRDMTYNRLMTLEAIRMHAAEHNGQLPKSLDDLSPVPAMPDPFSGKAFEYRVEDIDGRPLVILRSAGPKSYVPMQELRFQFAKPER